MIPRNRDAWNDCRLPNKDLGKDARPAVPCVRQLEHDDLEFCLSTQDHEVVVVVLVCLKLRENETLLKLLIATWNYDMVSQRVAFQLEMVEVDTKLET